MEQLERTGQVPTTRSMPDLVQRLHDRVKARGVVNLTIGPETRQACRDYLRRLDETLRPAPRERVLGRIATLMAHYWTPQMPANLQEAVALDWSVALSDLPWIAIEQAALEWLRTKDRRPVPAQFRKMAEQCISDRYGERKLIELALKHDWSTAGDSAYRRSTS